MKQDARFCYPDPEVLALCSPVFRRMFESDFRERTAEWITLPGKTYKEFTDFLLCLYPDTQKSLTDDTVFSVFHLADEYQVEILQRKCEDYLMSKCKDTNTALSALVNILLCAENGNVHEVLRVAADYNESDLVSQCENHMIARCKKNEKPLIHGLVSMLSAADKHKLTKLKEEVLQLAVQSVNQTFEDF
ncbi:BAT38-like protein [Mya arenaria]|uniref:BAT38-like protein n=1 Tax=Mya arenaria TaxID=6604 RepID=A0ABY7F9I8_MYAAR|nr:BAT38-like protein [Mya arenaria]